MTPLGQSEGQLCGPSGRVKVKVAKNKVAPPYKVKGVQDIQPGRFHGHVICMSKQSDWSVSV